MDFVRPTSWEQALAMKSQHPDAVAITGGTDVMVELNFDVRRPAVLLDLTRTPELTRWAPRDGHIRLGAAVTYTRIITELGAQLPGLAMAARTVGSPQIRNRGTVGGNLGAASPAGDAHPILLATGAEVEAASVRGIRRIPVRDFFTGVKRNALDPDELIAAVWIPEASGPQQFCKIGTRNAMVIAVAAFGLALHPALQRVGTGLGSAAPTPRPASDAEDFISEALTREGLWESRATVPDAVVRGFGELVGAATSPIDDARGTAAYRRHSVQVLARRAFTWAWDEYRGELRDADRLHYQR